MLKIERLNIENLGDTHTWLNPLVDKVNELVDLNNQFIESKNNQVNEITTTVANIESLKTNMSTLKYSADKIDCNFKASIDTLSVNDGVLKNAKIEKAKVSSIK